jgi:hypothetical protein
VINTTIEKIKERKHFYRDLYRKELIILIVLMISQFVLVGLVMYGFMDQKIPAFYASTSDGILSPLKAMPAPNRSDKPLLI